MHVRDRRVIYAAILPNGIMVTARRRHTIVLHIAENVLPIRLGKRHDTRGLDVSARRIVTCLAGGRVAHVGDHDDNHYDRNQEPASYAPPKAGPGRTALRLSLRL